MDIPVKGTSFVPYEDIFVDYISNEQKSDMKQQHYHDRYEVYFQADGERYLFLDDVCYRLKKGDIYIVRPFALHRCESREIDFYQRYVVNFNSDFLGMLLNEAEIKTITKGLENCVIHLQGRQSEIMEKRFEEMRQYYEYYKKGSRVLSKKVLCASLLQLVSELHELTGTAESAAAESVDIRIVEAIEYMNRNYTKDIGLDDVSRAIGMSRYHFCRAFHEATGATFLEYLNNMRLMTVHKLLKESSRGLNDIAARTGFSSTAHMTRVFKKAYGVSPREFRKSV